MPDVVKVFVFPPSREVLETRLEARGHNSPESIARRLEAAAREMGEFGEYDYAIINDVLDAAVDELRSIVVARRLEPPEAAGTARGHPEDVPRVERASRDRRDDSRTRSPEPAR